MKTKGLALKDAIDSGKLFRFSGWVDWWKVSDCGNKITSEHGDRSTLLSVVEATAEQWEIKSEPREFWILREPGRLDIAYASQEHVERLKKQNYVNQASEIIHVKEVLK